MRMYLKSVFYTVKTWTLQTKKIIWRKKLEEYDGIQIKYSWEAIRMSNHFRYICLFQQRNMHATKNLKWVYYKKSNPHVRLVTSTISIIWSTNKSVYIQFHYVQKSHRSQNLIWSMCIFLQLEFNDLPHNLCTMCCSLQVV